MLKLEKEIATAMVSLREKNLKFYETGSKTDGARLLARRSKPGTATR